MMVWLLFGILLVCVEWAYSEWEHEREAERIAEKWRRWESDYARATKHLRWQELKKEQEEWKV